jgi:cobalt/nickel transport system permease protein/cobalt/nickel transport protein
VALGIAVVALLLAGVVSYYASDSPDGLNRVAQDKGFAATEKDHRAADGPFAGYRTEDVGNDRLSGAIAGVVGVGVVLVLVGGLVLVVRRRRPAAGEREPDHEPVG